MALTRRKQAPSGRRPIWTEGGQLFTVRYVRAQPSNEFGDMLHSTPPLLRIPARYMPSGTKKARSATGELCRAALSSRSACCLGQAYWRDLLNVRTELVAWMQAQVRLTRHSGVQRPMRTDSAVPTGCSYGSHADTARIA